MPDGEFHIEEDQFKSWPREEQLWRLFLEFNRHRGVCDKRFLKIEKRKRIDTAVSAISGGIGGAGAVATFIFAKVKGWFD